MKETSFGKKKRRKFWTRAKLKEHGEPGDFEKNRRENM